MSTTTPKRTNQNQNLLSAKLPLILRFLFLCLVLQICGLILIVLFKFSSKIVFIIASISGSNLAQMDLSGQRLRGDTYLNFAQFFSLRGGNKNLTYTLCVRFFDRLCWQKFNTTAQILCLHRAFPSNSTVVQGGVIH